ncbi:MAG: hypothetical protein ACI3XR_08065, partial [Eubacteriales bacterium]
GIAVTSDYKSNASEGWSFDPDTNTLTLTDGDKFTAAHEKMVSGMNTKLPTRTEYNESAGGYSMIMFAAAVEVKSLSDLTVVVKDDITIGNDSWPGSEIGLLSSDEAYLVRTYGFYSKSGSITFTGGGTLTVYSTDTAIYTKGDFCADNIALNLYTGHTAAIFAEGTITLDNGANVYAKTEKLGGIYKSYYSRYDYSNSTVRYDSMAAVISGSGVDSKGTISIQNGSSLTAYAIPLDIIDTKNKLADEPEVMSVEKDSETGQITNTVYSEALRSFYGIWSNRGAVTVTDDSNLKVTLAPNSNMRKYIDNNMPWLTYMRTIAVNATSFTADNSYVEVRSTGLSGTLGHDAWLFLNEAYGTPSNTSATYNWSGRTDIIVKRTSTFLLSLSEYQYTSDNFHRLISEHDPFFKFYNTDESGRKYYYIIYPEECYNGDLYVYLKCYEKGPTYYLRENNGNYEYSEYFDFRTTNQLGTNTIDFNTVSSWIDKTIYVRSGDFIFTLPENNDMNFAVDNREASITFNMTDGKKYNGCYNVTLAGNLIVQGDGIIKQLNIQATSQLVDDAHPGLYYIDIPKGRFYLRSGTVAGGTAGGAFTHVYGGNLAFDEQLTDRGTYENWGFSRSVMNRVTIDLGKYADIFDASMIRLQTYNSFDKTGVYPVDGKIYFWEIDGYADFFGRPPSFDHLEITEEYTYFVYPEKVSTRYYTLYRLAERTEIRKEDNSVYFGASYSSSSLGYYITLNSFYYAKVVDIPEYYNNGNTTVVLDTPKTYTLQNGDYAKWYCIDKNGNEVMFAESHDSLVLTADNLHYKCHDFRCELYDSSGTLIDTHYFDVYILGLTGASDKFGAPGATVTFNVNSYMYGTWFDDYGFNWCWEWRTGEGAEWNIVDDTDETFSHIVLFNQNDPYDAATNSHGYQFRRVAYANVDGGDSIVLVSKTMTLSLGVHVTKAPDSVFVSPNDPADSILITVEATRVDTVTWYKKDGENRVLIPDATTLTLTFARSAYTDESGNWDPTKMNGTYICRLEDKIYGTSTEVEITVAVTDPPSISNLEDIVTVPGSTVEFKVDISGLIHSDSNNSVWWEYSLDDGKTWVVMKEGDSSECYEVKNFYTLDISIGGGPWIYGEYTESRLNINTASINADKVLVRCMMKDKNYSYPSNIASITFVELDVIERQPEDKVLSVSQGTGYIDFELSADILSKYTVTYQWQDHYVDASDPYYYWRDISSGSVYTCNDSRIDFDLTKKAAAGTYRCKITITDEEGVTIVVYTNPATLTVVTVPTFATDTPSITIGSTNLIWEGDTVNITISAANYTIFTGFKWQVSKDNGNTWEDVDDYYTVSKSGSTLSLEFIAKKEMKNWKYRCVIINAVGDVSNTTISKSVNVLVYSNECANQNEFENALMNAAKRGYKTIKLVDDFTFTRVFYLRDYFTTDVTIDLNGHTIQVDGTEFMYVYQNVTLTIIDSNPTRDNGSDVPFTGGSIRGAVGGDYGGAFTLFASTLNFNGGTIYNCTSDYGAAVYVGSQGTNFYMNGGQIIGCNQAVYTAGKVYLNGGVIEDCPSAIVLKSDYRDAALNLNGTIIRNCVYEKTGTIDYYAPIYIYASESLSTLTMSEGSIESCGNKSGNGGAIYIDGGTLDLKAGTIKDCYAQNGNGGAIYIKSGKVVFNGTTIENCSAKNGGGLYNEDAGENLYLTDSTCITGCTATEKGGAIYSVSTIYADGGLVDGGVEAKAGITKSAGVRKVTSFFGNVVANGTGSTGRIDAGMYYDNVSGISEDTDIVKIFFYNEGKLYATLVLRKGDYACAPITPEDIRTLLGWFDGDLMYGFNTPVTEDLTLVAKWVYSAEALTKLENELEAAKKALEEAIASGDKALEDKIKELSDALDAAKAALEAADESNKSALEDKIASVQSTLQTAIDQVQKNLDDAKAELDKAIADGDKALDDKIKALNDALDAAKAALDAAGESNTTALESQISAAQATLQAAIDALNDRLVTAENELTAIHETENALITAIIVICIVFAVADGAILTAVMIRTRKKKE